MTPPAGLIIICEMQLLGFVRKKVASMFCSASNPDCHNSFEVAIKKQPPQCISEGPGQENIPVFIATYYSKDFLRFIQFHT
jgi:hypothetical protein